MIIEISRWIRVSEGLRRHFARIVGKIDELRFLLRQLCSHLKSLAVHDVPNAISSVIPVNRSSHLVSIWSACIHASVPSDFGRSGLSDRCFKSHRTDR